MTVLEVIQRSSDFLARKGVESPRLQIELLLAHVLGMPRLQLYLNFEKPLDDVQLDAIRTLVVRRGEREPLQHIVGSANFCGYDFLVSRDVLVPRPETEILAEKAWRFLEAVEGARVLDFGTGSGCLAITLAKKRPQAEVHAVEISPAALAIAKENAARMNVSVHFHLGDGFSTLASGDQFHLIVANPPYIPTPELETLEPEVSRFDPRLALDGGPDGLAFYQRIAVEAAQHLVPGGTLMMEFGDGQEEALAKLFSGADWMEIEIVNDLSNRPRILIARRPES